MNNDKMTGLLLEIWKQQREYNDKIKLLQPDIKTWNESYLLGIVSEVSELLDELKFKRHRRYTESVEPKNVRKELADLTKYCLCLWQEQGCTVMEVLDEIWDKGVELNSKLNAELLPPKNSNVIISDLDGTIADFRKGFADWLGKEDRGGSLQFDLDNGMAFPEYEKLKTEFEREGGYATLPPYADGIRLLLREQAKGTVLFFTTARPVDRFQRIWKDTKDWLEAQGLDYSRLLFCGEERIFEMFRLEEHGNKVLLLEDNATIALRAHKAGKKVWVRIQPYNKDVSLPAFAEFPSQVHWEAWNG